MMKHATLGNAAPKLPVLTEQNVESILVQHGYRLTRPRLAVISAALRHRHPFTAEQLVADLGTANGGAIGRATIYRTLEILAAVDVLTRLIQADGHPAYICDSPGHRHHIVCSGCGTAVAFTFCPIEELAPTLARDTAFEIHDHLLEVFGVCPSCQDSKRLPPQAHA
ncbi:MAG: transcriptional repressor [Chloroflexia bacterium]|nr:transcriptional repressor [Chloroflexia bacterium]